MMFGNAAIDMTDTVLRVLKEGASNLGTGGRPAVRALRVPLGCAVAPRGCATAPLGRYIINMCAFTQYNTAPASFVVTT